MTKMSNFSASILLTFPWKVVGALDRPKIMTWYLKLPYQVLNTVIYLLPSQIFNQ